MNYSPKIYWFTGQPGSGKTTLGSLLHHFIDNSPYTSPSFIIDGDDIREMFKDKDYSENGRRKNISKAQDIAIFLNNKGYSVIVSLVSPYKDQREEFKKNNNVVEIYVHTEDIRGRENYFVNNYEQPTHNFIDLNTTNINVSASFNELLEKLDLYKKNNL